jgi:hypothetical protein
MFVTFSKYIKSHKNFPARAALFNADGWMDRQADLTKLTVAFA